jgi:menaquinone-dependent protoporphyrinogen oxidase
MSSKALIVYGTRYGATAGTSEEIADVLRGQGIQVDVVDAKKEKIKDISDYDLIVVGSGMQMGKWTGAAEGFLKKFQKELSSKKVAIFVSSAAKALTEHDKDTAELAKMNQQYLTDKAAQYNLQPVSMTILGGVWDYNKMSFIFRKTLSGFKPKIEEAGIAEKEPGLYDTRDWDEIRAWAKEIARAV